MNLYSYQNGSADKMINELNENLLRKKEENNFVMWLRLNRVNICLIISCLDLLTV